MVINPLFPLTLNALGSDVIQLLLIEGDGASLPMLIHWDLPLKNKTPSSLPLCRQLLPFELSTIQPKRNLKGPFFGCVRDKNMYFITL